MGTVAGGGLRRRLRGRGGVLPLAPPGPPINSASTFARRDGRSRDAGTLAQAAVGFGLLRSGRGRRGPGNLAGDGGGVHQRRGETRAGRAKRAVGAALSLRPVRTAFGGARGVVSRGRRRARVPGRPLCGLGRRLARGPRPYRRRVAGGRSRGRGRDDNRRGDVAAGLRGRGGRRGGAGRRRKPDADGAPEAAETNGGR